MSSKIQLGFECSVRVDRDRLLVSYEVRNASSQDAGLFNHVGPVEPGSPVLSPDNVYVDFDSGLLELLKQVLPIPGGMQVSSQPMPLVSKLPKGRQLQRAVLSRAARKSEQSNAADGPYGGASGLSHCGGRSGRSL